MTRNAAAAQTALSTPHLELTSPAPGLTSFPAPGARWLPKARRRSRRQPLCKIRSGRGWTHAPFLRKTGGGGRRERPSATESDGEGAADRRGQGWTATRPHRAGLAAPDPKADVGWASLTEGRREAEDGGKDGGRPGSNAAREGPDPAFGGPQKLKRLPGSRRDGVRS